MAGLNYNDREARWAKRYANRQYQREHYLGHVSSLKTVNVCVPADVERREVHEPCFKCGLARGPCRHRPWQVA